MDVKCSTEQRVNKWKFFFLMKFLMIELNLTGFGIHLPCTLMVLETISVPSLRPHLSLQCRSHSSGSSWFCCQPATRDPNSVRQAQEWKWEIFYSKSGELGAWEAALSGCIDRENDPRKAFRDVSQRMTIWPLMNCHYPVSFKKEWYSRERTLPYPVRKAESGLTHTEQLLDWCAFCSPCENIQDINQGFGLTKMVNIKWEDKPLKIPILALAGVAQPLHGRVTG